MRSWRNSTSIRSSPKPILCMLPQPFVIHARTSNSLECFTRKHLNGLTRPNDNCEISLKHSAINRTTISTYKPTQPTKSPTCPYGNFGASHSPIQQLAANRMKGQETRSSGVGPNGQHFKPTRRSGYPGGRDPLAWNFQHGKKWHVVCSPFLPRQLKLKGSSAGRLFH